MKNSLIFILILCLSGFLGSSCEREQQYIPKSDFVTLPTQEARNFESVVTDSGKIQLILKAPLVRIYEYHVKDSPYSEFPEGFYVELYNGKDHPQGHVSSKYAKYTNNTDLWLLRDSVVVVNENNERLETEILYWDQKKDLIYTDHFVKITTSDLIMQGIGFESDSHLNHRKIKSPSAEIYVEGEE